MEMSLPHNSVFSTKKTPHPTRQELQVSKPSVAFQIAPQQAASLLSHICHVAKALEGNLKNSENFLGEPKSWFWKKMAHIR